MTRNEVLAAIERCDQGCARVEDLPVIAKQLCGAMDALGDLIFGEENVSTAEELLNNWEPIEIPEGARS